MRSQFLNTLGVLALLTGCTASPTPTAGPAAPATERIVVRPVTEDGLPAAGFTATDDMTVTLECGSTALNARPSPVAVDDNILNCSPSSAFGVACWQDPDPGFAVCFRDPWGLEVVRLPSTGSFPASVAFAEARPLGLLLSDGERCLIRSGGVWNVLDQHPDWYGTYACTGNRALWAESDDGIDRTTPRWTVNLAPLSGTEPLHIRDVVAAYYVGTAEGRPNS
ncbi:MULTISPECIES: hypothetical protein [Cryobacterium]|uniref:Secreted protein n=1 Tax=Cryobacterium breve TaxID=1259258 RepID=A0ABY2IXB0_9MICO|nr:MULTISPECIES: hypothetical protein [Cryobacterium]TFC97060.1 hypothetical protein E3T20_03515 [Cryobacterium sp. TmT3-12]TFC97144.1 hypothetical protein E3O65_09990 [Cryobacterium breve]